MADIAADLQTLNALGEEHLGDVLDMVFAFLERPTQADLVEGIAAFCEKYGVKQARIKNTVRGLLYFFKGALRDNLSPSKMQEELLKLSVAEDKAGAIAARWKADFARLSRTAVGQTLSVNQLVDVDWRFGVTASSSELNTVGSTFLQLKLVLDKGAHKDNVFMELTLPQFYKFLHELEKVNAHLELF